MGFDLGEVLESIDVRQRATGPEESGRIGIGRNLVSTINGRLTTVFARLQFYQRSVTIKKRTTLHAGLMLAQQ
jgi:hypothetical protein